MNITYKALHAHADHVRRQIINSLQLKQGLTISDETLMVSIDRKIAELNELAQELKDTTKLLNETPQE